MSLKNELAELDATAQAELVRRGEVTPHELVETAITRIEAVNPELNAVVTAMYDEAREIAAGELPDGPFPGVPFLLKDITAAYRGVRTTLGSRAFAEFIPKRDSELVVRLRRAGLVVVGKTNTPEFGLVTTTEPELFGPCRNPWDTARTPGGSSGGSAAAVAAGMVPMAHATDGGGSIRIPASCCGVFGLKPTRGRNPLGPTFGDIMSGLLAEHAVTRSVRDSAALLDATSGPDVGDPYWPAAPERPFVDEVGRDPGRLRIAMSSQVGTRTTVDPDCLAALAEAVRLCEELGHEVVESSPSINDSESLGEAFTVIWSSGVIPIVTASGRVRNGRADPDAFEPLTLALYEIGKTFTGGDYLIAVQRMQRAARRVATWQSDFDLWLTPTLAEPPVPLGTFAPPEGDFMAAFLRGGRFAPFTAIANVTGQPAMSVPLFWNDDGLPIGVQFIARYGDEATLFRLAAQLEEARPWAGRHPGVWAGE
jgi:amidase